MSKYKSYKSYEDYIAHQAQKLALRKKWVIAVDTEFQKVLASRLLQYAELLTSRSVLCLGARLGGEVKVFQGLGCFAVGIDINPGAGNSYVLHGDFHALTFPVGCVDVVFINCLDHALSLNKVLLQIRSVLRQEGHLITEISRGTKEGYKFDKWDVHKWEWAEDIVNVIASKGFVEVRRQDFNKPWPGVHVLWTRNLDQPS